ncbi:hypothetical protein C8R47DRAFT_1086069 [Mycena vitilis]|nr:hypothetical protein C8R47DRAFT_1086069 [Mycena vitilis]
MSDLKPHSVSSPKVKSESEIDVSIALEAARRRIKELEDEVDLAAATSPNSLLALVNDLQEKNESLIARKKVLKAKIAGLKEKNEELQAGTDLQGDYEALEKRNGELELLLADATTRCDDLMSQQESIKGLKNNCRRLKSGSGELKVSLKRALRNASEVLQATGMKRKRANGEVMRTTSAERAAKRLRQKIHSQGGRKKL